MRVSDNRWVDHSKKTGAKTRLCFTGFKHPSIRLGFLYLTVNEAEFLMKNYGDQGGCYTASTDTPSEISIILI